MIQGDFDVFEIRTRAPRVAQNPKTLERVLVPTKKTVKFKVGRMMKLTLESEPETARIAGIDIAAPARGSQATGTTRQAAHLSRRFEPLS